MRCVFYLRVYSSRYHAPTYSGRDGRARASILGQYVNCPWPPPSAFIYRDLSLRRDYDKVFVECATIVGGVLLILGVALGFTNYLIDAEIPSRIIDGVQTNVHSKYLFLLMLNLALLVVGALMDAFAAILVVVPPLKPLAAAYAIDPVQMGIIFIANLEPRLSGPADRPWLTTGPLHWLGK